MAPVCVRHRTSLAAGLRALWSEIAAREGAALASVEACGRIALPLAALARDAGYPRLGALLDALVDPWCSAAPDACLSVDRSIDLAAWCDTLVIGLNEGLDRDAIELLCILHDGGAADPAELATALAAELDPARPQRLEIAAAAPEATPAATAPANPEDTAAGIADPAAAEAARRQLGAMGVDCEGLSAQEVLDLLQMLAVPAIEFVEVEAPETSALPETSAAPDSAARERLGELGVDSTGLSAQDVLDLLQMLDADPVSPSATVETPDADVFGTLEAVAAADVATTPPAPARAAEVLWIAEEELALTRSAITEQVMPGVMQLVDVNGTEAEESVRQELGYQLGLIANALQMFGIESLDSLLRAAAEGCLDRRLDGEALIRVSAALLDFMDRAEVSAARLLAHEALDFGLVDADFPARFEAEVSRVQIGLDPALIAARKRHIEPGDLELQPAADVLPDVLNSMLRELPGNSQRLGEALRALVERGETAPMDEARRVAHTLKGDANTVGVRGLANLTHSLEDALIELLKSPERLTPSLGQFLLEAADVVEECADHLLGRGPAPPLLQTIYQQALDWSNRLFEAPDQSSETQPETIIRPPTAEPALPATAEAAPASADTASSLAVDTRLLDELQRLSGELTILSRQVDQRLGGLLALERELRTELSAGRNLSAQLDDLVALRGAALQSTALSNNPEVDALELDQYNELHTVSRRLSETHGDNEELVRRYARLLRDLEPLRAEQQRLNEDLQRTVARTRTLPFGEISARLQRVVRQTARQLAKPVDVRIEGEATPIDAELLERLVEPLSHLLRNAVDHGIEIPELRRAAGKAERGTLRIAARIEADRVHIEVVDDGRGLDLRAIRAKAVQLSMITEEAELSAEALAGLILAPGFSTRDSVSQVSGRGVGMDVVNQRIQSLRGSLSIHTDAGRGTRFILRLPLSRRLANVVVVDGHGVSLAVVAAAIRRIVLVRAEDLAPDPGGGLQVELEGQRYPAQPIEALFDRTDTLSLPGERPGLGLLVDLPGGKSQVLCVRSVGEITQAIVKPASPLLPSIPALRGLTQLGDGRPAPVVDLDVLLDRQQHAPAWQLSGATTGALPRIVVADDSLSVRRALEQLMQDAGYEVAAARDGLEALQLIQQRTPVAVLLDLEMPRMNGLEVCRSLRSDGSTRGTPVVMITSRASDKYRLMAEEAGVTRLIGKPFAEDDLVNLVRELVAAAAADLQVA
ncbi:MAG: response regulator [Xanthomonadales bacterium]|jgi:chemotaxis protein histidine kinase CheA|nr:response regulator [Xanthomonadales bacterium]